MSLIPKTEIRHFDYDLPPGRIARYPVNDRDRSKLLVYSDGMITDALFYELDRYLPKSSLLVWNDTRVIKARLMFQKKTGARIEIFLLDPYQPADYQQAFAVTGYCSWKCLVGNAGKWKEGALCMGVPYRNNKLVLEAEKISTAKGEFVIVFRWDSPGLSFGEVLEMAGSVPIPPYLNREPGAVDRERYQTVYAEKPGSVAAPTAGLHFTPGVTGRLHQAGIGLASLTLHVGAGTFRPIREENVSTHPMHTETFSVPRNTIETFLEHKGPLVATGTTTVRTLESLYWLGARPGELHGKKSGIHLDQWVPYQGESTMEPDRAMTNLLEWMDKNRAERLEGSTGLMIVPGYRFRLVHGLITNYHMPRSSLLLLIAAFIGSDWRKVYRHALDKGYRFLSYGDSSLLLP